MTSTEKAIVDAIRADVKVGVGSCSTFDECYTDEEIVEWARESNISTPEEALKFAREIEGIHWERVDEANSYGDHPTHFSDEYKKRGEA